MALSKDGVKAERTGGKGVETGMQREEEWSKLTCAQSLGFVRLLSDGSVFKH